MRIVVFQETLADGVWWVAILLDRFIATQARTRDAALWSLRVSIRLNECADLKPAPSKYQNMFADHGLILA